MVKTKVLPCLGGFLGVAEPMGLHTAILMIQISGVYLWRLHIESGLREGAPSEVVIWAGAEAVAFEINELMSARFVRIDEPSTGLVMDVRPCYVMLHLSAFEFISNTSMIFLPLTCEKSILVIR